MSGGLSGAADQQVFAMLRALADVILVGAGTARVEGYRPVRPRRKASAGPGCARAAPPPRRSPWSPAGSTSTRRARCWPRHRLSARTIVITDRGGAARAPGGGGRRTRDVIVAGRESVDIRAAVGALAGRGYRCILTEGGPYLLARSSRRACWTSCA